ncbi:MAG TPA: glycogen synthase GlgA [Chloroflexota bacterium]
MGRPLRVLFAAAEAAPFAKVGGLADVAGALPKALAGLGHDVRVVVPRYGAIDERRFPLTQRLDHVPVPMGDGTEPAAVLEGRLAERVPVYFVDNPRYFFREQVYGYPDDGERFVFYARAALAMLPFLNWQPDVIHANDWHTGLIPVWLKTVLRDEPSVRSSATVFTIHNLAYQGVFSSRLLRTAGLERVGPPVRAGVGEQHGVVNLMALGIRFADVITTVSETYAREIVTPEYGERLDALLRERQDRLYGILNGIDVETFDPTTDPHLAANFDQHRLDRRRQNKVAVQREVGLPEAPEVPLMGMVSRLADQKGFDILGDVVDHILDLGVQFVLLGTGEQHYHDLFRKIAAAYPRQAAVSLTFDLALAQRIYGGCDLFLMPSRYEPCGLGQMIAMRYGAVPVVRKTGGLADTVQDWDPAAGRGTGFVFERYDRWALFTAVVRALETLRYPDVWRRIQRNGMSCDFSWTRSAQQYERVYHEALAARRQGLGQSVG